MSEITNEEPVASLHENDVLFGRGMGPSMYIGTQKFRELCEPKKQEYQRAKNKIKADIAHEIIQQVTSKGGRFLRAQEKGAGQVDDIVNDGTWYRVTDEKEILAKVMQALRQKKNPMKREREQHQEEQQNNAVNYINMVPHTLPVDPATSLSISAFSGMSLLPPPLAAAVASSLPAPNSAFDPRLLLFQQPLNTACAQALFIQQQQQLQLLQQFTPFQQHQEQESFLTNLVGTITGSLLAQQQQQPSPVASSPQQLQKQSPQIESVPLGYNDVHTDEMTVSSHSNDKVAAEMSSKDEKTSSPVKKNAPTVETTFCNDHDEEDVSEDVKEFLMSVLQLSGLPRFTNHAEERANMSNDEKAAALSDMFGKYCNVDLQKNKRARRDLDPEAISFLIQRMRDEMEGIPNSKKEALLQAQQKCGEEEFSDERLERFLRCEGMDAQLAAKRFVRYWDKRRQVFGPDKYTMKMTLSEALRDDITALQVGWFQLLPNLDASGRQLMYLEPARHKKKGYTSESLLRAAWYVMEVTSRANKDIDSGVIQLVWDKYSTVWEYDHWLYKQFLEFFSSCWPCRFDCYHVCCTPKFIVRVVVPILSALQSKRCRTRSVWHDVPEHEILSALSEYGITGDMIPTEFGGSIQLNPSEWIANRRAVEMEEI